MRSGINIIVDPRGTAALLFPELAKIRWIIDPDALHQPPRTPQIRPTRLQREHANREAFRKENRRRRRELNHPTRRPESRIERRLALRLVIHAETEQRDRDRYLRLLTHGPLPTYDHPLPPPPEDDPPPF